MEHLERYVQPNHGPGLADMRIVDQRRRITKSKYSELFAAPCALHAAIFSAEPSCRAEASSHCDSALWCQLDPENGNGERRR